MSHKLELARLNLAEARRAQQRKDFIRSSSGYGDALLAFLSDSVYCFEETAGIAHCVNVGVVKIIEEASSSYEALHSQISEGKASGAAAGNAYVLIVLCHLSLLVGSRSTATSFANLANNEHVRNLSTPFWDEYTRALLSICEESSYTVKYHRKLKGEELYWLVYLRICEAATHRRDCSETFEEAKAIFAKRNADKRLRDDIYEIEGSGLKPARWDFRLASLQVALGLR